MLTLILYYSRAKPILGYISFNVQTFEWQIALTGPTELPSETETDAMQEDVPAPGPQNLDSTSEYASDQEMQEESDASIDIPSTSPPVDPKNPMLNSYEQVKLRFEKCCAKILMPHTYVYIRPNGKYKFSNQTNFVQNFSRRSVVG